MPTISLHCPKCGAPLEKTDGSLAGGAAECPKCGGTMLLPALEARPGMEFGGFMIERKLGVGGMGEVWLATQTSMSRKVALKILPPALSAN